MSDRAHEAPPLIHIGYHKTGSTWLQRQVFEQQPGLDVVTREEIVATFIDRPSFGPAVFGREGRDGQLLLSHERLSGHPFSGGFDSEVIARRLAQVFPDGRVLIVIRHQPDMLRAIYAQYVRRGGPLPLARFVADSENWHRQPHFRFDFLEYDRLIELYHGLFGRDQVTTVPYELLRKDRSAFVDRVSSFAQQPLTAVDQASVNPSLSSAMLAPNRLANRVVSNPGFNRGATIVDEHLYSRLGRALRRVDDSLPESVSERLSARHRAQIDVLVGDRYLESNRRTSELADVDLASFGWRVD